MTTDLFKAAKEYLELGFSVIPVKIDPETGSKAALISWKEFQRRHPTLEELENWFLHPTFPSIIHGNSKLGLAIVTGRISGNLFVIDFDSVEAAKEILPELQRLYPDIFNKFINTWIVRTGKGVHYYFKLKDLESIDPKLFGNRIGIRQGIDIRAEGGYVVASPSPHPSGKHYEFVKRTEKIAELTAAEYLTLLSLLESKKKEKETEKVKSTGDGITLPESKILEIVNTVRSIYHRGHRNHVVLFLSGWLKKAGISYDSARKIVEILAEGDEEKENRLYQVDRTYGLKGNPPSEEELKGKSGLQEIAEKLLSEEKALELIRKLEELLGKASPFRDSVFSLTDFDKRVYYVANPRRGIIARAYEKNGEIVYKELIAECCPVHVTVYEDPLGGVRKFEIEFDGLLKKVIGPADLETIVARLRNEGVVKHKRLIEDALSSLVIAFIRNGKAEIKRELEKPGFYYIDEQIKAVKWEQEDFTREDIRRALTLLKELRENWFKSWGEKFTTIIKWGILAPFSYAIKQIKKVTGVHFPDLVVQGKSNTGKTTTGLITLHFWNPPSEFLKETPVGEVDTRAKHGRVRSLTTFHAVVNEVGGVFHNKELVEDFKTAVESKTVRGKHISGIYQEIPSLRAFYMTSNPPLPLDDTLRKRWLYVQVSYSEKIPPERMTEFEREVLPRLHELRFLGYFVFAMISENPEILKKDWRDASALLLKKAFEFARMEVPEWIDEFYRGVTIEEVEESVNEEIRARLLENINQLYSRHISRINVEISDGNGNYVTQSPDFKYRLVALLEENFIPWAVKKDDNVVITNSVLKVLDGLAVDSLKSLAERFGWKYDKVRISSKSSKWAAVVKIDDFVSFLEGNTDENEEVDSDVNYQEWDLSEVLQP